MKKFLKKLKRVYDCYAIITAIPMGILTLFSLGSIWVFPIFITHNIYVCVGIYIALIPAFLLLLTSE